MKLYSRKHFLLAMVCILPIIHECKDFEGAKSVLWAGFFLYMMIRCIMTAFSAEMVEQDKKNAHIDRKVRKRIFGPLWRIPPIVFMLAPLLIGAFAFSLLWPSDWANLLMFLGMAGSWIFTVWFNVRYRNVRELEEKNEQEEKAD